jgi:hypothetical protein
MTSSRTPAVWRRIAVTATAAGAIAVGAVVATGNAAATADEGTASNGINAYASAPSGIRLPGPITVPSPVLTALEEHGTVPPPPGFDELEQVGSTATQTSPGKLKDALRGLEGFANDPKLLSRSTP